MATKIVPLMDMKELEMVGVRLMKDTVDGLARWRLICNECNATWLAVDEKTKLLPQNYWHCPNGCNCAKPKPKPKPEPEPEEDPLEKAIGEALAGYNLYQKKMREAQTDEETEAHRRKSEEYLDEYLGLVEERNAGDPPEPQSDEQKRFEAALDRYLGGKK